MSGWVYGQGAGGGFMEMVQDPGVVRPLRGQRKATPTAALVVVLMAEAMVVAVPVDTLAAVLVPGVVAPMALAVAEVPIIMMESTKRTPLERTVDLVM